MGRFKKLSHAVYDCKYHIVWCPKYRYRVLLEEKAKFVETSVRMLCEWKGLEVEALAYYKLQGNHHFASVNQVAEQALNGLFAKKSSMVPFSVRLKLNILMPDRITKQIEHNKL